MAVTFVTNERSHELNLEYRDTDRPTDVISLEYKPELDITFDEEDLLDNLEQKIEQTTGFVVSNHEVKLYGHCAECRKKDGAKSE